MSKKITLTTQVCSNPKCPKKQPRPIEEFAIRSDNGKRRAQCKDCVSFRRKIHYQGNREQILSRNQDYYWKNQQSILAQKREYQATNQEQISQRAKEYRRNNKEKVRISQRKKNRKRLAKDPLFKLRKNISRLVNLMIKAHGGSKCGFSILKYLQYSVDDLMAHIEVQFEPWMTWTNYGKYDPKTWDDNNPSTWTWQLDHIIPHSTFNYKSMKSKAFRECWALSNLRPLSAKQNNIDGATRIRHNKTERKHNEKK